MDWWLVILIAAVPTYFVWAILHECSHLIAAHAIIGITKVIKFIVWPWKVDGVLRFGWVQYQLKRKSTKMEMAQVAKSPTIMHDLLFPAIVLTTVFMDHTSTVYRFLTVALCGGLVDSFVWNLGIRKGTDIQKAYPTARSRIVERVVNYLQIAVVGGYVVITNFFV